uniref:VWFA domain-containing protein n=1 Tax=Panagrolaimus sp. JU765 TaxID=591449 RepID=A0AC34Q7Z4_9BILA
MVGESHDPSRIGFIEFTNNASIILPLIPRSFPEFSFAFDNYHPHDFPNSTNLTAGLEKAYSYFEKQIVRNRIVILMTDSIVSEENLDLSLPIAKKLKEKNVNIFGIDISNSGKLNLTNLGLLASRKDYAFYYICMTMDPITGIIPKMTDIYPAARKYRTAVIFIGEMTTYTKENQIMFLNSADFIARNISLSIADTLYALGLYGNGIIFPPSLGDYRYLQKCLNDSIHKLKANDSFSSNEIILAPMLESLLNLVKTSGMHHYIVLFMGQTGRISDFEKSMQVSKAIASQTIFFNVLDLTVGENSQHVLFQNLVKKKLKNIKKYKNESIITLSNRYFRTFFSLIENYI